MSVATRSIYATQKLLRSQSRTAVDLVYEAKANTERHHRLNCLAWVDWDVATREAEKADNTEPHGPLHGIPITVKDIYAVANTPLKAGTKASLPSVGRKEAVAVKRLRDAGAIILAKTNMHEVALGITGQNQWTGDVLNPADEWRMSGGSSSGAAAAVAVGIGLAALGSETVGSIRIPSAFCGVTGFKPSFGTIPLSGALHLSWSMDHAGVITNGVEDCELLYNVLSGNKSKQPENRAYSFQPIHPGGSKLTLGVPWDWLRNRIVEDVRDTFELWIEHIQSVGVNIVNVPLCSALKCAYESYTTIMRAEAAWVHRKALAKGGQGFSADVLYELRIGAATSATQYIEAMHQREHARQVIDGCLAAVDALILPTTGAIPPLRGQGLVEVEDGSVIPVHEAILTLTAPFSVVGVPTISIPYSQTTENLPLGLSIISGHGKDEQVLSIARYIEENTLVAMHIYR